MGDFTKIEWADATLNLWWGCTKVSDGCKFCYAEHLSDGRFKRDNWGPKGHRTEVKSWRKTLAEISARAKSEGRRLRVFCQSMSDTFEGPETCGGYDSENWALIQRLQDELFTAIQEHPELDFLLLTKRPENVWTAVHRHDSPDGAGGGHYWQWPDNLWLGTSVEDQKTADERIHYLLDLPAKVRFLSCEPLLGPVDLASVQHCLSMIHWVIVGGESGDNARPMHPEWARSLRDQCASAGIPFLFKQWGEWVPDGKPGDQVLVRMGAGTWCDGLDDFLTGGQRTGFQDGLFVLGRQHMQKVGKKQAGRELDGETHDGLPEAKGA